MWNSTSTLVTSAVSSSSLHQPRPTFTAGSMPSPAYQLLYPQQPHPQENVPSVRLPRWIQASRGSIPPDAVVGGIDCDGETLYVARAHHEGSITPGKLKPSYKQTLVPWGGRENQKRSYEVLCGCSPKWVPSTGGRIPTGALAAGKSETGEILFIGRASHGGAVTPGKVQSSHGVCYMGFDGEEIPKRIYEVLVL